MNNALASLATLSTGATAPASTFPNMFWFDTAAGVLKKRNAANTAWENFNVALGVPLDSANTDLAVDPDAAARRDIVAGAISAASHIKAWVNFNGIGTVAIRAAFNVSSVTDSGVGRYTINFATPLADVDFAVVGSGQLNGPGTAMSILVEANPVVRTTTSVFVFTVAINAGFFGASDTSDISVAILR